MHQVNVGVIVSNMQHRTLKSFEVDKSGRKYIALLVVEIISCQKLKNSSIKAQAKGIADPYVQVTMGTQVENTSVKDNDLDPVFEENILLCWDGQSKLHIKAVDSEDHGDEEVLGQTKISIDRLDIGTKYICMSQYLHEEDGRRSLHGSKISYALTLKKVVVVSAAEDSAASSSSTMAGDGQSVLKVAHGLPQESITSNVDEKNKRRPSILMSL